MGRPRIPTSLKRHFGKKLRSYDLAAISTGTFQGSRYPAKCPHWLNETARKIWRETVKDLQGINVDVTASDQTVFAAYCLTLARLMDAEAHIEKHGQILTDWKGRPYKNPSVTLAKEYGTAQISLGSKFGLDPVSRRVLGDRLGFVTIDDDNDENNVDDVLSDLFQ